MSSPTSSDNLKRGFERLFTQTGGDHKLGWTFHFPRIMSIVVPVVALVCVYEALGQVMEEELLLRDARKIVEEEELQAMVAERELLLQRAAENERTLKQVVEVLNTDKVKQVAEEAGNLELKAKRLESAIEDLSKQTQKISVALEEMERRIGKPVFTDRK